MHAAGVVIGEKPLWEYVPCFARPRRRDRHPVRQGRGREGRPGEVRLPRPQDAHRHRHRGAAHQRERDEAASFDLDAHPARRRRGLQDDLRGPTPPACSSSSRRASGAAQEAQARLLRGHHRRRRALSPGPARGRHGRRLHRAQARAQEGRATRTRRSSRSSRTPTASSSTRSRSCRSPRRWPATRSARPTFFAAPWARRRRRSWPRRRPSFLDGAEKKGVDAKIADERLRPDGEVRRLRLQQVALGGLRPGHLSDRVPEALLPGGVLRRPADLRQGQHRQGRQVHRRGARAAASRPAARRQRVAARLLGRAREGKTRRSSASACRRSRASARARSTHRRRARDKDGAVQGRLRLLPAHRSEAREQEGARGAGQVGRVRLAAPAAEPRGDAGGGRHRRRARRRRSRASARAGRATCSAASPRPSVRRRRRRRRRT